MTGHFVSIPTEDGVFSAYVNEPAGQDGGAIVVLQEIFGLTPFVTGACDFLSDKGYVAIAPDLFWRQRPGVVLDETERDEATALMKGMDENLALDDARLALEYAKGLPACNGRSGALGYCLGGKLAFLMAATTDIDAAVSYYGVGIQNALSVAPSVTAPILLHFGADDPLCPPPVRDSIIAALRSAPCAASIEIHPNVGHAFARRGGAPYNEEAASRADATTLAFLKRILRDPNRSANSFPAS